MIHPTFTRTFFHMPIFSVASAVHAMLGPSKAGSSYRMGAHRFDGTSRTTAADKFVFHHPRKRRPCIFLVLLGSFLIQSALDTLFISEQTRPTSVCPDPVLRNRYALHPYLGRELPLDRFPSQLRICSARLVRHHGMLGGRGGAGNGQMEGALPMAEPAGVALVGG